VKCAFRLLAFGDIDTDGSPSHTVATSVENTKDIVEHPYRFAGFEMSEASLDSTMALAQHTWEKLISNKWLVFRKEEILYLNPATGFEIIQAHKAHSGAIDIERPEFKVAYADEFQASVCQGDEFLPLFLGTPLFGDVDARTDIAGEDSAACKPWRTIVQHP